MKTCSKCRETKPLDMFYDRHKRKEELEAIAQGQAVKGTKA